MAERAKDAGPESNGPRTGPITSLSDALKSIPGDQFHLLSQPNSDQPSVSTSSRDTARALGEPEKLMALFDEYDNYEDAKEFWESDRNQPKKWFLATKVTMIALVAVMFAIAIAIPLVYFNNNRRLADVTPPRAVVARQTATAPAPAVAKQSGETALAAAEVSRPGDPANGPNTGLTPQDTPADSKSVAQDQNVPPQAPAVTQGPARTDDKKELANALAPADTKSMDQGQNVSPQAQAAPQSPASSVDKDELATGPSPDQTTADAKSIDQGQSAPPPADQQSPTGTIDQEKLAAGPTPEQTVAVTKSVAENQNAPPQAQAAAQSPQRTIDKEQLASLLKRGRYLLSVGDIASARLLLGRAADAHDAGAAFDLAGTYDPAVLGRSRVFGIVPDAAMARMWYEKALSLGYSEARERLTQLQK